MHFVKGLANYIIYVLNKWSRHCRRNPKGGGGVRFGQVDWGGEKMESPPRLGLGTINIAPFHGKTDLTNKSHVRSLGMGMGRC